MPLLCIDFGIIPAIYLLLSMQQSECPTGLIFDACEPLQAGHHNTWPQDHVLPVVVTLSNFVSITEMHWVFPNSAVFTFLLFLGAVHISLDKLTTFFDRQLAVCMVT
jgi:hypothetical protein